MKDGRLLGRITVDDVVDVIREEADHSVMSMAGLDEDEDMFAGVVTSARRRAIWLSVNLATAFLAANVVGLFEATIEKVVALAVLMPIVASMGGIAGSQTLVLIIRGLALGQIEQSNARWLLLREILVGLLNGVVLASLVGLAAGIWFHEVDDRPDHLRRAHHQPDRSRARWRRRAAVPASGWASIPRSRAASCSRR